MMHGYLFTPKQIEVIRLILEGNTSDEISAKLNIAKPTVSAHRAGIYRKLRKYGVYNSEKLKVFIKENAIKQ